MNYEPDNYDFDTPVSRRNTYSLKWDVGENELPMWVADMDFRTAPEIIDALQKRAGHGIFGYTTVPEEWYRAIMGWWKKRHGFQIKQEWLLFCTGVVPAISSVLRKLTTAGENIVVQTPVYNIFFHSIENNGRHVLENRLQYDGGRYSVDFYDLEQKLSDPQTSMMILCNPHNPAGILWDRETLRKIGDLCSRHHVLVLSDEIHCDLTDPGADYIPFASVSESCSQNSITCIAPTKAFNLAGLQSAAVVVPNELLRHKVNRALNTDEIAEPGVFAVTAAIAAFTKGEKWLDALRRRLYENKRLAVDFLERELPELRTVPSGATYLLWIDCGSLPLSSSELSILLRQRTGLYLSDGRQYGGDGGHFLRMNLACPLQSLKDGLERLKKGISERNGRPVICINSGTPPV